MQITEAEVLEDFASEWCTSFDINQLLIALLLDDKDLVNSYRQSLQNKYKQYLSSLTRSGYKLISEN